MNPKAKHSLHPLPAIYPHLTTTPISRLWALKKEFTSMATGKRKEVIRSARDKGRENWDEDGSSYTCKWALN